MVALVALPKEDDGLVWVSWDASGAGWPTTAGTAATDDCSAVFAILPLWRYPRRSGTLLILVDDLLSAEGSDTFQSFPPHASWVTKCCDIGEVFTGFY